MDRSKIMIIGGILILLFDLVYNLLYKPISIGYLNRTAIAFGFCCILFGVAQDKIITIFRIIGKLFESRTYHVLFIILIISLLIRLIFLPERWINPDEGAHLYDAKFILDGKVPFVDYGSRMPVYVYILAAFLKIFGCSYMAGRLLPLFSNIGIGILVFLIGNKLFNNKKIALLASGIYLFSPLSILWSVVVKNELPETLFVCIGMFLLLSYIKSEKEKYSIIFFSGIFFSLAYYVRKSAIVILLASLLIVIYFYKDDLIKLFKTYSVILLGYLLVVFIIVLYFSSFMGFTATWQSSLNPMNTVIDPIQKIAYGIKHDDSAVSGSTEFRLKDQLYSVTISEWKTTLKLNIFLLIGLILSIAMWLLYHFTKITYNPTFGEFQFQYVFLYSWFFAALAFYVYYSAQRGFFNQYFGELLPPLTLILSHVIYLYYSASIIYNHSVIKPMQQSKPTNINYKKLTRISTIISKRMFQKQAKALFLIILLTTYVSSLYYFTPSFGGVWSPQTVQETSQYLLVNSDKNTEIMSGAVIWSLESNTKPFLNITHPLEFRAGISGKQIEKIKEQLSNDPPRFIILDGYTEQTYLRHIPEIQDAMNESYHIEKELNGSKYPVQIYELKRNIE